MTTEQPYIAPPDEALIRLDEVLKRIPVSRSQYYVGQRQGLYPAPVRIGEKARAYRYSEVRAWLHDPEAWRRDHQVKTG